MTIKYISLISLILMLLLMVLTNCKQNHHTKIIEISEIVDDLGNSFQFESVPQRVITLAPNLTEMIYELEVDTILIGNTTYCNYPNEAKNITKVGDLLTVDFEKIVSLKPDLIFITVEGNSKNSYDKLKEYGFRVFVSNPRNYEGIKKTLLDFSKIFGKNRLAEEKICQWDSVVYKLKVDSKSIDPKSAMFLISIKPIMLAGKNTFVNEFLKFCKLKNVASVSDVNYPLFSREEILNQDPDYIIHSIMQKDVILDIENAYPEWSKLSAINKKRVISVDPDLFFRPGPRFVLALQDLYKELYN